MNDEEILEKVKIGLAVDGDYTDDTLKIKTMAVKQYMLNAGVSQSALETDLGIATLTIGVNDIWSLESGEIKFSFAFDMCLMPQLKAISI
ncbi:MULTISPECIES: hypothetical protein [unclassified Clostridium]|uniref:hypothetical protein n=1 Tax=unclassified Clostridium TaxID=2614128 RepID=UPI0002986323|nr:MULTISPECIES: hypothetical protein [unclassified Clostridium]EKQ50269.1 MAG: hypothetical protein A370_05715 [Clostridium sp. Maddingley MBC34-26]